MQGVLAPVLTPFDRDLNPDAPRFARFCRSLLEEGCAGLAPFGTTSEANSLSLDERERLLDALLDAGIPAEKPIAGTGCCALPDTARLSRKAARAGCAGVLMLPPFYYKNRTEEQQREIDAVRAAFERFPLIAGLKEALAARTGDPSWRAVRPPLVELTPEQRDAFSRALSLREAAGSP